MSKNKYKTPAAFGDTYQGCQVVANLMGLNVETVRKRAKAGTIPATQNNTGTWIFVHADLVAAGISPFATAGGVALPPNLVRSKKNVTDVIFVLDGSGSMNTLMTQARNNLEEQVRTLQKNSGPNDEFRVSVLHFDSTVKKGLGPIDVSNILPSTVKNAYVYGGGMTALYDAIGDAIRQAVLHDDGKRAFLISVITDGGENSSTLRDHELISMIAVANAKDRYTFTYAGPRNSEVLAHRLGIPAGNCTSWDQTVEGTRSLGRKTTSSLETYTRSRAVGVMKSASFYAEPTTKDAGAFAGQLDDKLDDVTKDVTVKRVGSRDPIVINKFCEKTFGSFEKGKYFYQLTESEKVQDYKKVVIQDGATGSFYSGWKAAKKLLGIPEFQGTVRIKPGNLGEFKIFIQSTSTNRKLVPGTAVVYLP